jgi:hypothetical protein
VIVQLPTGVPGGRHGDETDTKVGDDGPYVTIPAHLIPHHPVAAARADESDSTARKLGRAISY